MVIDGCTVWALLAWTPRCMSRCRLGVDVALIASGRRPSMLIMITCSTGAPVTMPDSNMAPAANRIATRIDPLFRHENSMVLLCRFCLLGVRRNSALLIAMAADCVDFVDDVLAGPRLDNCSGNSVAAPGNCSSTAVPDAVLGNRSLRCSRSLLPARLSATAPCVALTPASLQSYLLLPWSRNFLPLTARNGGNAKGLKAAPAHPCARGISASDLHGWRKCRRIVGTIPAIHVRTILALQVARCGSRQPLPALL